MRTLSLFEAAGSQCTNSRVERSSFMANGGDRLFMRALAVRLTPPVLKKSLIKRKVQGVLAVKYQHSMAEKNTRRTV